jgi:hypothetical protein
VFRASSRPHGLERILPTGAAQLIVNLKEDRTRLYETDPPHRCVSTCGTILAGVQSRYQIIDTSEQEYVAGVAFRPGGSTAFVRAPAHETRDVNTPIGRSWRWIADTGIRRTSFMSSGCFRDSRRPVIGPRGPHFRTTSNFYNPTTQSL